MRAAALALALALAACGPKHTPPPDDDLSELEASDQRPAVCGDNTPARWAATIELTGGAGETEIERRQNAACDAVMPKLTACVVEDACAKMDPKELNELDPERTAAIHLRENHKTCVGTPMSSRQVRVYEVCMAEETECGPLAQCLENARPE